MNDRIDDLIERARAVPVETETSAADFFGAADAPLAPKPEHTCEQCGERFMPRSRSGGSPQRFCCSKCRVGFQRNQRYQQSPPSGAPEPQRSPVADETLAQPKPSPKPAPKPDPDAFNWSAPELVVIHEQPETAIYRNPRNGLVIRQRGDDPFDDDRYVYISEANIADFLDMVTSVGRRK